jgi:hypothetical protein
VTCNDNDFIVNTTGQTINIKFYGLYDTIHITDISKVILYIDSNSVSATNLNVVNNDYISYDLVIPANNTSSTKTYNIKAEYTYSGTNKVISNILTLTQYGLNGHSELKLDITPTTLTPGLTQIQIDMYLLNNDIAEPIPDSVQLNVSENWLTLSQSSIVDNKRHYTGTVVEYLVPEEDYSSTLTRTCLLYYEYNNDNVNKIITQQASSIGCVITFERNN